MTTFVLRRVAMMALTLLVSSTVVYWSLYLAPGNPLAFLLGNRAVDPAAKARLERQHHLDEPAVVRFFRWLGDVITGDLGYSIIHGQPVSALLAPRVGVTVMLTVYAALLIVVCGVGLGIVAALRGGVVETVVLTGTTIGLAVPTFVAAIVFVSFFSVQLGWFPVFGAGGSFLDRIYHLTLPAVALALSSIAYVSRVSRTALRQELSREHVVTATARGFGWWAVLRRHVLRNAMISITTVSAVTLLGLIASSVVIEEAFGLGGIGSLLVQSVQTRDFAVVQAICLVYVGVVVVVSMMVDVGYAVLDPRTRPEARS